MHPSQYNLFLRVNMRKIHRDNPDMSNMDVMREASKSWQSAVNEGILPSQYNLFLRIKFEEIRREYNDMSNIEVMREANKCWIYTNSEEVVDAPIC